METITLTDESGNKFEADVSVLRPVPPEIPKVAQFSRDYEKGSFEVSILRQEWGTDIGFVVRGGAHLNSYVYDGEEGSNKQAGAWLSKPDVEKLYEHLGKLLGK